MSITPRVCIIDSSNYIPTQQPVYELELPIRQEITIFSIADFEDVCNTYGQRKWLTYFRDLIWDLFLYYPHYCWALKLVPAKKRINRNIVKEESNGNF